MAAATVASGPTRNVIGNKRRVSVKLTAPADNDTYDTGLYAIDDAIVSYISATIAAADAVGINSISGGVVTFEVVGTARDVFLVANGI